MSKSAIELLLERADYLMRVFCGIDEIREEDLEYSDFDLYHRWKVELVKCLEESGSGEWVE